ncbi:MAG: hypothetical protein WB052_17070, partial [Pseudolabrys sp.]
PMPVTPGQEHAPLRWLVLSLGVIITVKSNGWEWCSMSALGHKRTFAVQYVMSALPPKADMCSAHADVR